MSCKKHGHESENCVCAILSNIADVQDQVDPIPPEESDCIVSCENSIQELLAPITPPTPPGPNTIPVILYCGCDPFKGFGVKKNAGGIFECVQTFVFRVSSVDEECCAVLELLETVPPTPPGTILPDVPETPCEQFPAKRFRRTGICITMDLNCFCGVTCLEAVTL